MDEVARLLHFSAAVRLGSPRFSRLCSDRALTRSGTSEVVVWQWPGNQQYDYFVAVTSLTSTDCANATQAFLAPSTSSASGEESIRSEQA